MSVPRPIRNVVLPLHALQLAFMLWIAFTAVHCCDAEYYVATGSALLRDGIGYHDDFAGYRSYFVPLVLGLLGGMPFTLSVAFTAVSLATSAAIVRREGLGRWLVFAAPTFFNPFLIAQVPIPMQESVLMLLVVPLVVALLALRRESPVTTMTLAALAASVAFIVRGSMGWIALALALFVLLEMRATPAAWRAASRMRLAAIAIVIPLLFVAPQSVIMAHKLGTADPYPNRRDFALLQAYFGVSMIKTTTMLHQGKWTQMRVLSPFDWMPREEKMTFGFYAEHRGPATLLVLGHIWAGLHYEVLTTYVRFEQFRILNPWIVLSSLAVALGALGLGHAWRGPERSRAAFLAATFALSCLYTAFVGVEARFGLFGFLALSIAAAQLLASADGRAAARSALPLVCAYVILCVVFNAVLLYATPDFRLSS